MMKLIPALGFEAPEPYTFKTTNTAVTTFEEALWHCYVFWRQSADDFCAPEFADWVESAGAGDAAERIRKLPDGGFATRFVAFLRVAPYFEEDVITTVEREAAAWERRLEWEKLKETGDFLLTNGDSGKALEAYRRALSYEPNESAVYHNAGVAAMRLGRYGDAEGLLLSAVEIENRAALDETKRTRLDLALAECYVLAQKAEQARELLAKIQNSAPDKAGDVNCLLGRLEFYAGNVSGSLPYFEKALELNDGEPRFVFRVADVYVKLRQYEKALEVMNRVAVKDVAHLRKLAEIYTAYNNVPAAIRCVEKALMTERNNIELWTKLAELHRLNYEPERADASIRKALSINKQNPRANLEWARIKKAQGKIKDYQSLLKGVLDDFKQEYRERAMENVEW